MNDREIMRALLDGKTIVSPIQGIKYRLKENNLRYTKTGHHSTDDQALVPFYPNCHIEENWYDDIPEEGVLCYVKWCIDSDWTDGPMLVVAYGGETESKFTVKELKNSITGQLLKVHDARPVPKEVIQKWLNNYTKIEHLL